MSVSKFISTYTSYSGADLIVTFGNQVIGELQQISWAIERHKVPVFTFGSPNARSFSRGKRGIAGSLVVAQFDHDSLMKAMKDIWDQIAPKAMFTAAGNSAVSKSENFKRAMDMLQWNKAAQLTKQVPKTANNGSIQAPLYYQVDSQGNKTTVEGFTVTAYPVYINGPYNSTADNFGFAYDNNAVELANPVNGIYTPPGFTTITKDNLQYVDQCPPFDVTLTFANEYGQCSFMKIYDLEILNEASGVSVDSVVMEKNYTWIGRNISSLYKGIYTRSVDGTIVNKSVDGSALEANV